MKGSMRRHVENWADVCAAVELLVLRLAVLLSLLWAIIKLIRSEW
jgi:hypothetical protein